MNVFHPTEGEISIIWWRQQKVSGNETGNLWSPDTGSIELWNKLYFRFDFEL